MSEIKTRARAAAELVGGRVIASVDIAASPERTFRALASAEIVDWWVNPGVFGMGGRGQRRWTVASLRHGARRTLFARGRIPRNRPVTKARAYVA